MSNSNPTNILRITGAKATGAPVSSNAPATGTNPVNEIAAFDLTFNRPAAGSADLVFSRSGPTDFSGSFVETDGAELPILPNVGLNPSYPTGLSITIPQQVAGGGFSSVPEPGSVVAISVILGGLGFRTLRRRRQNQAI